MDHYGYEHDFKLLKDNITKLFYSLREGLFYGMRIHFLDIDDASLQEAVTHEGGFLCSMDEADIIVSSYCCELEFLSTHIASPFWILRVLRSRTLEKPHKPLDYPRPLQPIPWKSDDCSTLIVSSTGFSPEEKEEIKAMVHLAGGLYSPELAKTVDVLLVSPNDAHNPQVSSKVSFAKKHRIPMVSLQWLEDSWRHWTWLPFTDYYFPIETSKQIPSTSAISP